MESNPEFLATGFPDSCLKKTLKSEVPGTETEIFCFVSVGSSHKALYRLERAPTKKQRVAFASCTYLPASQLSLTLFQRTSRRDSRPTWHKAGGAVELSIQAL